MKEIINKKIKITDLKLEDLIEFNKNTWVNPRINDFDYPLKDDLLGEWKVQVIRIDKKMNFEDIVKLCNQDGYKPATIYHLLNFVKEVNNLNEYKSLMAPGSICIDDFEYTGCVVLSNEEKGISLGLHEKGVSHLLC